MQSNNPYAPPTAVVADVALAAPLPRPRVVTIAVVLLWTSILMGMPVAIWRISTVGAVAPVTFIGMFLVAYGFVCALCFWLFGSVRKGKNWARITILVMTALYIAMQPWGVPITLAAALPEAIVRIAQLLLWISASALLLAPASRAWYLSTKGL
jgi:hypothetical protein